MKQKVQKKKRKKKKKWEKKICCTVWPNGKGVCFVTLWDSGTRTDGEVTA